MVEVFGEHVLAYLTRAGSMCTPVRDGSVWAYVVLTGAMLTLDVARHSGERRPQHVDWCCDGVRCAERVVMAEL